MADTAEHEELIDYDEEEVSINSIYCSIAGVKESGTTSG